MCQIDAVGLLPPLHMIRAPGLFPALASRSNAPVFLCESVQCKARRIRHDRRAASRHCHTRTAKRTSILGFGPIRKPPGHALDTAGMLDVSGTLRTWTSHSANAPSQCTRTLYSGLLSWPHAAVFLSATETAENLVRTFLFCVVVESCGSPTASGNQRRLARIGRKLHA